MQHTCLSWEKLRLKVCIGRWNSKCQPYKRVLLYSLIQSVYHLKLRHKPISDNDVLLCYVYDYDYTHFQKCLKVRNVGGLYWDCGAVLRITCPDCV